MTHSTTTKVIEITYAFDSTAIQPRYDYDEKLTRSFFARVESRRMEAVVHVYESDSSCIIVESQL